MGILCDSIPESALSEEVAQKESISYDDFLEYVEGSSHSKVSAHAILVVARKYANEIQPRITYDLVLKLCRYRLQKLNFDRYDELEKALSQCPAEDHNLIDPADVYRVCVGVGLPLKNDLLTALIQKVPKPKGRVDYKSFVEELNSKEVAEESVPFIPDSRLSVPNGEESGWYGLRDFHCNLDSVQTVNIRRFAADLLALKRAQAQSPKKQSPRKY
ncbi:hypothetical protein ACHWQZ_G019489 [Mnemiopsis leidyi]